MRNLKVIGLAALAVLAVSAASASAATETPARAKVTGSGEFTATQTAGSPHTFTLPGGRVLSCATITFSGTVTNGATVLSGGSVGGSASTCHTKVGETTLKARVDGTACSGEGYDLTTAGGANTYVAKGDLTCPNAGEAIHVEIRNAADTEDLCRYTVDPQGPFTGVHLTDNANNTINIKATNVAVAITRTFGTVGNCGAASSNSLYNGDTLVTPAAGVTIDVEEVID